MASSGFKIKVGLDATAAERGLASIGRNAGKLNRRLGRLAGAGLKLGAGLAAASAAMAALGAAKFIKDSSKAAADFELMATGFQAILGSSDKAAERIKKLQDFSVKTPFEPAELIKASKLLETLGGETIAIGEGLTLVGDAAAASGAPLEEMALHTGRLFQALTQGGAAGESLARLQELGVLSGTVKRKIQELSEQQRKGNKELLTGAQALTILKEGLGKTTGAMELLSQTTAGKVSTMRGNLDLLKIAFGEGINDGLEKGVDLMNEKIPEWMEGAKKLGGAIGRGIGDAFQGNTRLLELQITFAMQKIAEVAGAAFLRIMTNVMSQGIPTIIRGLNQWLMDTLGPAAVLFAPVMAQNEMVASLLQSQGTGADFDIGDFTNLTAGALGSEQTGKEINEHLARLVRLEETRAEKEFNRKMHDGIITAAYENLSYAK